ncbi:MAG: hypothetical protein ACKOEO_05465, partial [Planctomycetaceae bacterium]
MHFFLSGWRVVLVLGLSMICVGSMAFGQQGGGGQGGGGGGGQLPGGILIRPDGLIDRAAAA